MKYKASFRAERFVATHDQIHHVLKEEDSYFSLLAYLGLGSVENDLPTLSQIVTKIPDEALRWDVLDWLTEILSPEDLLLTGGYAKEDPRRHANLLKRIAEMLAVISTNDYLHGVPSFLKNEEVLNGKYRDRALLISKSYAFLFFMDDRFGTEKYHKLKKLEKKKLRLSINRMTAYLHDTPTPEPVTLQEDSTNIIQLHQAELAFRKLIDEFKEKLPNTPDALAWWEEFKVRMVDHLRLGNKDLEDKKYTAKTYAKDRQSASGMNWAAIMGEFLYFKFIPRKKLKSDPALADFTALLTKTEHLYKRGGGEINDDFSFIKEVVKNGSAVNMMVVVFNQIMEKRKNRAYSKTELREVIKFLYTIADKKLVTTLAHSFLGVLAQEEVSDDEPLVSSHFTEIAYLETIKINSEMRRKLLTNFFTYQEKLTHMLEEKYAQGVLTPTEHEALKFKLADWLIGILATIVWQLTEGYPRYESDLSIYKELQPNASKKKQVLDLLGFFNEQRKQRVIQSLQ